MGLSGKSLDICFDLYVRNFFKSINSVIDMSDQDLNISFKEIESKFKRFQDF